MQATWFGYPNSTGLDAIAWRLTDALSDPPGENESRYTEKLLRLCGAPWLYKAPEETLPIRPLPHTRGEPCTFGCLNNPAKTSEATLAAWIAILRLCPQARLVLMTRDDEDYQQQLRRRFALQGVSESQLLLVVPGTPRQFYEYHYQVDLLLDPFPYNGAVTTCDALWMGIPVISVVGSSYVSRQGLCVLPCWDSRNGSAPLPKITFSELWRWPNLLPSWLPRLPDCARACKTHPSWTTRNSPANSLTPSALPGKKARGLHQARPQDWPLRPLSAEVESLWRPQN